MIVLVSGATAALRELNDATFGGLFVPQDNNNPAELPAVWALDNGAYTGLDVEKFVALLRRLWRRKGCVFVAAPDVVGDAAATLALFPFWRTLIVGLGYPVALVAQNGLRVEDVPWDDIDALFIGGDTAWKLGPEARDLASYAKARGKWLHMGRVNSRRRIRYAMSLGCDSIDGSGWSRWSRKRLPLAVQWIKETKRQPWLPWGGA